MAEGNEARGRISADARPVRDEAPGGPSMGGPTMGGPAMASGSSAPARPNGALGITNIPDTLARPTSPEIKPLARSYERYRVSVAEYVTFHSQGFLIVRGLVSPDDVAELRAHTEDLIHGRIDVPGLEPPPPGASVAEIERRYLRIHMLHRVLEIHERYLLHPRILDVLEALIGPDVLAMQTMLFIKPPGGDGQGYHQDSYYIPTLPDTLCGAWLAIDRADEENGCMWFTVGTQHEPIYPTTDNRGRNHGDSLADLEAVENVSHTDDGVNTLSRIARKYPGQEVPAIMDPGDVAFFAGHVLHRSHRNRSADRFRRSFVGHYANARSYTRWGSRTGAQTNDQHILARGTTHLPFGLPRFGTPCAANQPRAEDAASGNDMSDMMPAGDMLEKVAIDPERNDPSAHAP
jgi:phytanoyl-CoA hydroxylase